LSDDEIQYFKDCSEQLDKKGTDSPSIKKEFIDRKKVNKHARSIVLFLGFIIFLIIYTSVTLDSTDNDESEEESERLSDREVADLVKQYKGKDGRGDPLVDVLATMINVVYLHEDILDNPSTVIDWYAFEDLTKKDGVYKVGFIFKTYKEDVEYIWYVDTNTNTISAGSVIGKEILNILDTFD